jgi:hypothetical protein
VLISSPLYGQDEFKPEDAKHKEAAEATEKIEAFFEDMEDVMAGPGEFARIVKELKSDLKKEYQENEQLLLDAHVRPPGDLSEAPEATQIKTREDRQKVIAQCYVELTNRVSDNSDMQMDLLNKIHERFRTFRQENPKLAADARIRKKEDELTQQAMQRRMGFPRTTQQTLAETRRNLSANSDVAMAIDALDPIEPVSSLAHPGEQQGPIQEQRGSLRAMLKLKWKGENLSIDREHWDVMFAGMTVAQVQSEVDSMLQQKGAELEDNRRAHGGMHVAYDASNVERLFQEFRGTGGGSHSRGGSGETVQTSFRKGSIEARLKLSPSRFELTVEELQRPRRLMRVVESEKGLEILLVGDLVHRFSASDGELSVVELSQEDVLKFQAESFADLYRQEPRFVEMRFFALLDHLGIIPPASRFHPRIVSRLLEIIAADEARLQAEVDELVADLDADRFTTREAAYEKLLARMDDYYDLLYAKQDNEIVSTEVLARIRKLLTTSKVKEASQLDSVVSVLRLADDAEYLDELKGIVNAEQRESIERRLASLQQ